MPCACCRVRQLTTRDRIPPEAYVIVHSHSARLGRASLRGRFNTSPFATFKGLLGQALCCLENSRPGSLFNCRKDLVNRRPSTFSKLHLLSHPQPAAIMNAVSLLILSLIPSILSAQETATERNPWKTAAPMVPEAVRNARMTAQTVLKGGAGNGGDLIIQRIERPLSPPKAAVPAPVVVPPTQEELAARAARRALEPNELLLFSPTIVIFRDGLSLVRWGSVDRLMGYEQYAAFIRLDLSAIYACPDLTVGRRKYCMMPKIFHATDRMVQQWKAPAPSSFREPTDIILVEGDPDNKAALEPLLALLRKFDTDGDQLNETAAAMKADQEARAAWEAEHANDPPENAVIRFWTDGD